ncbi:MAG: hypothetical protein IPL46_25010 [Saprospiraceae bacterium]|nr:hypothetical protein [Saprospiraceae bacterium]
MQEVHIIKIGGNVLKDDAVLHATIKEIAQVEVTLLLVHGGGKHVDQWMARLGAEVKMIDGRRITDALSLELAVMNYAGLINKNMVALLQREGKNALGLSGADLKCITSKKRQHPSIDFGFVGDVIKVNQEAFGWLLEKILRLSAVRLLAIKMDNYSTLMLILLLQKLPWHYVKPIGSTSGIVSKKKVYSKMLKMKKVSLPH